MLTLAVPTVKAQYYSINIDYATIALMTATFEAEAATEKQHKKNLQDIRDSYAAAAVASSGILASKYLDRTALTSTKLWDDKEENYYYNRIYNMVSKKIIPKTIKVASMMVEDPSTAIYWGSYLLKLTSDVQSLCQQFESVVTNGKLSFKDIGFLEISEDLKAVFNLTKLGNVDWKDLLEHLGDDIESTFTKDNLEADLDDLINNAGKLAAAGSDNALNQLLKGTTFGGTFQDKIGSVITLVDNASSIYDSFKNLSTSEVLTRLVGKEDISNLFQAGNYNVTKWIDDYAKESEGKYYTRRAYIYSRDAGREKVCEYVPPTDNESVLNGSEWYRVSASSKDERPTSEQREAALQNSESYAGWSRARVNELNAQDSKYKYQIVYRIYDYYCYHGTNQDDVYAKAYAYSITVNKSWDVKTEVYEDVFDSYKNDWSTFVKQMQVKLQEYNDNEDGIVYQLCYDSPHYYSATDAQKIAGCSAATFSVVCSGGGELGKGTITYKCRGCTGDVLHHGRECSMETSVDQESNDAEIKELESKVTQLQAKATSLQSEIDELNAAQSALLRKMSAAETAEEQDGYRQTYNQNKTKIDTLQSQLDAVNNDINEGKEGLNAAKEEQNSQSDSSERIPSVMLQMQKAFGLTWADGGTWEGNSFIRNGNIVNEDGTVQFVATLSLAREPKYVLGIKIHRAIVQIDWKMTSSWSDNTTLETLQLDPNNSDEANADIVNQRLSELAQQYPECTVEVELTKSSPDNTEDTDGTYHLLWASDRLDIARNIDSRLKKIYIELVVLEKYLHYKHTVSDWLKDFLPRLNADKDRKLTIAERCQRRWMHNAGSKLYLREEEDDKYEEE